MRIWIWMKCSFSFSSYYFDQIKSITTPYQIDKVTLNVTIRCFLCLFVRNRLAFLFMYYSLSGLKSLFTTLFWFGCISVTIFGFLQFFSFSFCCRNIAPPNSKISTQFMEITNFDYILLFLSISSFVACNGHCLVWIGWNSRWWTNDLRFDMSAIRTTTTNNLKHHSTEVYHPTACFLST